MDEDEVRFPQWESESYTKDLELDLKTVKSNKKLDTAPSLVQYLEKEFFLNLNTVGPINKAALSGAFAQWKRNGITPDQIREMIRVFVSDSQYHLGMAPYWKKFLYLRDTLLERTTHLTTTPDSYWDEPDKKEQEFEWD